MTFTVPGKPSAWQRAQRFGKRTFNLSSMVAAQHAIAFAARPHIRAPLGPDYTGAVVLDVLAVFEIPKSRRSGKHKVRVGDLHTQKPDASNCSKNCEDALNGIAYHDDAQVADTRCRKVWGVRNETFVTIGAVG